MSDFWKTVEFIEPHKGWPLFSIGHVLWLILGTSACFGLALLYKALSEKGRNNFRIILASLILANLIIDQIFLLVTRQWTIDHLPLHFCCFAAYIIIIHAFTNFQKDMFATMTYGVGIPSTLLALFTPNWSVLPYWSFSGIMSFTFHFMLLLYPIMLMMAGYVPQFKPIKKALPVLFITAVLIFILNKIIGSDLWFMNGGHSVGWISALSSLMGIYGYLWIFPVIIAVVLTVMYLPIYLKTQHDIKKQNSKASSQAQKSETQ